jgi:hypothetical protein
LFRTCVRHSSRAHSLTHTTANTVYTSLWGESTEYDDCPTLAGLDRRAKRLPYPGKPVSLRASRHEISLESRWHDLTVQLPTVKTRPHIPQMILAAATASGSGMCWSPEGCGAHGTCTIAEGHKLFFLKPSFVSISTPPVTFSYNLHFCTMRSASGRREPSAHGHHRARPVSDLPGLLPSTRAFLLFKPVSFSWSNNHLLSQGGL